MVQMSEKHKEQIKAYYEGRVPLNYFGIIENSAESIVNQIPEFAWSEIPEDDICKAHWHGYHRSAGKSAEIFLTNNAIQIIQTGTFSRHKFKGVERIRPESITGLEKKKELSGDIGWALYIHRTREQDIFGNLDEHTTKLIESAIENWQSHSASNLKKDEDPLEAIGKLKQLLDMGALTSEEFESRKIELLRKIK